MGRPPKPPFIVRYTREEALAALRLKPSTHLEPLAEAAGISLGRFDTLSETQIRTISEHLDKTMRFPEGESYWQSVETIQRINPPKRRRGRLNAEEGLARLQASSKAAEVSAHAPGDTDGP
jgi:hypothetical protein